MISNIFYGLNIANRKNENARCVAYAPGQIWSRGLESFMITLYQTVSRHDWSTNCVQNLHIHEFVYCYYYSELCEWDQMCIGSS